MEGSWLSSHRAYGSGALNEVGPVLASHDCSADKMAWVPSFATARQQNSERHVQSSGGMHFQIGVSPASSSSVVGTPRYRRRLHRRARCCAFAAAASSAAAASILVYSLTGRGSGSGNSSDQSSVCGVACVAIHALRLPLSRVYMYDRLRDNSNSTTAS